MTESIPRLPSDNQIAVLALKAAEAWRRVYELEDNHRPGQWHRYSVAVDSAEAADEALALVPAQSALGVRTKYAVLVSRLPEHGGRGPARRSADRAGLVASIDRDEAAMAIAGMKPRLREIAAA